MPRKNLFCVWALVLLAGIPLAVDASQGAFYIEGNRCWCATTSHLNAWNLFPVWYIPDSQGDCDDPLQAAFRIVGVPDDPALQRRFDPIGSSMTGDVFGAGARFTGLGPQPGELQLGVIMLYLTDPLPAQTWSIEAHTGIAGVSTPVIEFSSAEGVWTPQPGGSLVIGTPETACDTCIGPYAGCPFAVESAAWSLIKQLYQ